MADRLRPLQHSHEATGLEAELKDLFIKLYADSMAATADDLNVYGAPHLGSFGLIERNIDQDGLTVLRETTEDRIRYLFKAWRNRNPERGLHFLKLYLAALFGSDRGTVAQLWQRKSGTYPDELFTLAEIENAGETTDAFFLTSRVRVDVDSEIVPAKLLASLRSAVAARILLNVRVGRAVSAAVGLAPVMYGSMVLRVGRTNEFPDPPPPTFWLVTEDGINVITEDDERIAADQGERYTLIHDGRYRYDGSQVYNGQARARHTFLLDGYVNLDGSQILNGKLRPALRPLLANGEFFANGAQLLNGVVT